MWAKTSLGIILASKIVGKGAGSQLRGRSNRTWGIALLARKARGSDTVGALTAIQYLGYIAGGVSTTSRAGWDDEPTAAQCAGSLPVSRPGSIPAPELHPSSRVIDALVLRPPSRARVESPLGPSAL
jgi:hypothetical protein